METLLKWYPVTNSSSNFVHHSSQHFTYLIPNYINQDTFFIIYHQNITPPVSCSPLYSSQCSSNLADSGCWASCLQCGRLQTHWHGRQVARLPTDTCYTLTQKTTTKTSLVAKFLGPTWGSSGAERTQVGPMLTPGTLLSDFRWIQKAGRTTFFGFFPTHCYPTLSSNTGISGRGGALWYAGVI